MNVPDPVHQPDEFRAWALLYLDRELPPSDERDFEALLSASEGARRSFAQVARFDAELRELRSQEELVESRSSSRRLPVVGRRVYGPAPRGTGWAAGVAAAAILLVILLVAVFSSPATPPTPVPLPQAKLPAVPPREPDPQPIPPPVRDVAPTLPEKPLPPPGEAPKVDPEPVSPPEAPPEKRPEAPAPAGKTLTAVARVGRLEQVQGQVTILSGKSRMEAKPGQEISPGQGIQTSRDSQVVFVFGDGTRLELGPEAILRDVSEQPAKQASLAQGTLQADVARQPVGQPMRLATPAADLLIIGTKFSVTAEPKATKLQVREGLVRMSRRKDGQLLDVVGGHVATAAEGVEFTSRAVRPVILLKGRSTLDLEALYLFNEGKGAVVEDVSGTGEAVDLKAKDESAIRWLPHGLLVHQPTALVSTGPATRITEACRKSHEITVEAWVTPAGASQAGPARIVSLSASPAVRAFMLGQGEDKGPSHSRFTFRLRTTATNENGMPPFISEEGVVRVGLTHLVVTRSRSGQAVFYVDGVERGHHTIGGDFSKWTRDGRLSLADEASADGGQPWLGAYYLVALYSRALPPDEVVQHFKSGPAPLRAK